MAGWASPTLRPETLNFVRAAQLPLASSFQLLVRAQRGPIHRALTAAVRLARGRRGLVLLGAIIGLVGLMLVPVPCQLRCDCELQPVVRRFVAAPFDGPLEKSLVEPGDVVVQDQLLAHMDGREIRWELAGTRADLHRAAKARAGHVATHESGKAELARYEVDRLQVRTELLEHRSDNLEIRSPVDGVVVSGDWKRAEGTPLKTGQTLFEIAPLDRMVLEVAVLERDVPYVEPGMPVRIRFDAFPLKSRTAAVESIHPRSELRDHANVFIAEVPVDNANRLLRPGMRGRAQVTGRPYPLGWNLFRRPIAAAIAWLGW
jgi:multidrug resistance efflux pump